MKRVIAKTVLALTLASAGTAWGATTKIAPSANPHIVYIRFNKDGVTTIRCELGVSTLVDLPLRPEGDAETSPDSLPAQG